MRLNATATELYRPSLLGRSILKYFLNRGQKFADVLFVNYGSMSISICIEINSHISRKSLAVATLAENNLKK